jgi:hypothetical protein
VANQALRERLKEWLAEKDYVCVVVHNHAGALVVGESTIELESKLPEELNGPLQITDRQGDEETSRLHLGKS